LDLNLSGSTELDADVNSVSAFLYDSKKLVSCIPNAKDLHIRSPNKFVVTITLGLSFISGNIEVECSTIRKEKYSSERRITGSGMGTKVDIDLEYDLVRKQKNITVLDWRAKVNVGGIASGLGPAVLKEASDDSIKKVLRNVKKGVEKA
jgi:carbon monoxide dehydrogenase subunit G